MKPSTRKASGTPMSQKETGTSQLYKEKQAQDGRNQSSRRDVAPSSHLCSLIKCSFFPDQV